MGKIKGTAIDEIRTLLKKSGHHTELKFKEALTPEERNVYERALPISWVELELLISLANRAADILYPNDPDKLIKVGIHSSKYSLNTVYKILIRVMSVEQVMKQTAKLWRAYHSEGKAALERVPGESNRVNLIITDYPGMTRAYLPVMAAYCHGTLEINGAKDIRIKIDDSNPEAWKFAISWK